MDAIALPQLRRLWQYRLWSFKSNKKYFCPKINIPKGNHWFLRIGIIKLFKSWCYQNMSKIKTCAPKLVFLNENKTERDSDDFWHRKFWHFLSASQYTNSYTVCWFLGKNLCNYLSQDLKLHNRYCHSADLQSFSSVRATNCFCKNKSLFETFHLWHF